MIDLRLKEKIDSMDYKAMLRAWRFAPPGEPMFQGETGEYFVEVMGRRRQEIGDEEAVRISKRIGW